MTSVTNLLTAWKEFKRGKFTKKDVVLFEFHLEDNLVKLHQALATKTYRHGTYEAFFVSDPKRRHIHKATVHDRVVHQAVFRILYPVFDTQFIFDSYSSRKTKGTHRGVKRLFFACRKVTKNWKTRAYVLKCDIKKFFDSIDHSILKKLIRQQVSDADMLWLIDTILVSFEKLPGKGLPLGNVTSQLFANIYLNEFDQFVKHVLKAKYYFRYCDDFVIVHKDRLVLEKMLGQIQSFLSQVLAIEPHPKKVEIRKIAQGIDFLGYSILPHYMLLRTKTKRRLMKKLLAAQEQLQYGQISQAIFESIAKAYLGVLSHARSRGGTNWVWTLIDSTKDT